MPRNILTFSIIIPVYNEERQIASCLDSLLKQTIKPFEIIVVDNNCTDKTASIAAKYPGVRIINERKQGLIPARNAGMRAARGDILLRIDADSRPRLNWIKETSIIFNNSDVQAATGSGTFYDFPFKRTSTIFRNIFAVNFNKLFLGHDMLWGSNMAIRQSAWRVLFPHLCKQKNIMEDLDIAMHVADQYGRRSVVYSTKMAVDISARRAAAGIVQNYMYLKMWPDTLKRHRNGWYMAWPATYFLLATGSPFINTISRFYDGHTNRWLLSRYQFRNKTAFSRENP